MKAAETRVSLQVLEVRAKKRTGGYSLVMALRNALHTHYPDKSLALGGTFIIKKGKAKIHIMVKIRRNTKHDLIATDVSLHRLISLYFLFTSQESFQFAPSTPMTTSTTG